MFGTRVNQRIGARFVYLKGIFMTVKEMIVADMKQAMKNHEKEKLSAIRMLLAAIKQKEVDERGVCDDTAIAQIIAKQIKQRQDSIAQYKAANRTDLADKEAAEISVMQAYLPKQLSEEEIQVLVNEAIAQTGAAGMAQMGKIMGLLRPKLVGRADMGKVSSIIRAKLTAK